MILDGLPYFFTMRKNIHQMTPICNRLECQVSEFLGDGSLFWIPSEIFINTIFTIELILRIFVSSSFAGFFSEKINIMDVMSILPFYVEVFDAISTNGGFYHLDFSILSSSPLKGYLVFLRPFKVKITATIRDFAILHIMYVFSSSSFCLFRFSGCLKSLVISVRLRRSRKLPSEHGNKYSR